MTQTKQTLVWSRTCLKQHFTTNAKTEMCALEGEKETCERPQSRQHPLPQHQVRLVLVSLEASLDRFKTGKY